MRHAARFHAASSACLSLSRSGIDPVAFDAVPGTGGVRHVLDTSQTGSGYPKVNEYARTPGEKRSSSSASVGFPARTV